MTTGTTSLTLRRLAIAKEMYLLGIMHANRESPINHISAILNFDYAVETIIKTALLDRNIKLEHKPGVFKTFDVLIGDLQTFYKTATIINEVNSLHKLRNDVQHHVVVPSPTEISRHQQTVKLFLTDICALVYSNTITFDSISLSFLIESQIEKIILNEMEKALTEARYNDAVYYARSAVAYHRELLQKEMELPHRWVRAYDFNNVNLSKGRYGGTVDLGRYVKETEETIEWIVTRLSLQEYYYETKELFGGYLSSFAHRPPKEAADLNKAEKARTLAYTIISGTEGLIKKAKDLDIPIVFDLDVKVKGKSASVQLGMASASEISEAKLRLALADQQVREIEAPKHNGVHNIIIDNLDSGKEYTLAAKVKNTVGENSSYGAHTTFKIP